ncbi:MAG: Na+/H+ antiporter subunit E [Acidobacteriota bacterium]
MTTRRAEGAAAFFLFLLLAALWLLLSGHYSFHHPLLLGFGTASVALVVALAWRMGLVDLESMPFHWLHRLFAYLPWLALQVVLSSVDVLRRGLARDPDVDPRTITIEGSQRSDFGLVSYANSITLTPGTTSLDSDIDADTITVHALSPEGEAELREGEMDRRVCRVEGS